MELISPAGNFSCVKAAVHNGANAIYVGAKLFNARRLANNFSYEELKQVCLFCHVNNVKVYLTMNTLVRNNELKPWFNALKQAYESGVDAVIIQDLTLAPFIKSFFPELKIHASTQSSIMNYHSMEVFSDLDLVVLARELTAEEIKEIHKHTKIKLEVFAHGHLCVSYSGQCLISSLIGKRSGNRGVCASSCRKKYNDEGYLISPKDLMLANHADRLQDAGVHALKLEGRMKDAEYVTEITKVYRKQIDAAAKGKLSPLSEKEIEDLKMGFNREFTKGFFSDEKSIIGKDMPMNRGIYLGTVHKDRVKLEYPLKKGEGISIWHKQNKGKLVGFPISKMLVDDEWVSEAKKGEKVMLPSRNFIEGAKVYLTARHLDEKKFEGEKKAIEISVKRVKNTLKINGPFFTAEEKCDDADKHPLTQETFQELFNKSSQFGYIWNIKEFKVENAFIPKSKLTELRRACDTKVEEHFLPKRKQNNIVIPEIKETKSKEKDQLIVKVHSLRDVEIANRLGVSAVYFDCFHKDVHAARELCTDVDFFLDTPVVLSDKDIKKIQTIIGETSPDGIVIGNWGMLNIPFKGKRHGKYSLNTFNDLQAEFLQKKGVLPMASLELHADYICRMKNKNMIYYAHGRPPVMHFKGQYEEESLQDEKGYTFPLNLVGDNTEMLYSRPIALLDKVKELKERGINYFFLDLRTNVEELIYTYQKILEGEKLDTSMLQKGTTIGNYAKIIG